MLLCDNCDGGYHLFCFNPELIQVPADIWYYSSCSPITPWFLLKLCHTFPSLSLRGDTWEFHLSLLLCIVYICVCISFWLINFYLWLVLIFLFSRVYYGFTPLQHRTSRHYTSWQVLILKTLQIPRPIYSYFLLKLLICMTSESIISWHKKKNVIMYKLVSLINLHQNSIHWIKK